MNLQKHYIARWLRNGETLANVSFIARSVAEASRKADRIAEEIGLPNTPRTLSSGYKTVEVLTTGSSTMSYIHVIPRDLFNEAKLLKCLGQLALFILDRMHVPGGLAINSDTPEDGFQIEQDDNSGALYCSNWECTYAGRLIGLNTPYNSKDAYPLRFVAGDDSEGRVFNDDGTLAAEFLDMLRQLKAEASQK